MLSEAVSMASSKHGRRAGFMLKHEELIMRAFGKDLSGVATKDVHSFFDKNKKDLVNAEGKPFTVKQVVDKIRSMAKAQKKTQ